MKPLFKKRNEERIELRTSLIQTARWLSRGGRVTTYGALNNELGYKINFKKWYKEDQQKFKLLNSDLSEIGKFELQEGRPNLHCLVINATGDNMPSWDFYWN